jgi:4-amino-4-deoxy-L-arabinose transferase-like glycosyltransferase
VTGHEWTDGASQGRLPCASVLGEGVVADDPVESQRWRTRFRRLPWRVWLAAIVAAGLAIRLGYVIGWSNPARESGDAVYYHVGANLLADGEGFIHPVAAAFTFRRVPGADHPPAYIVYLAGASLLGLRTFLAHQVWSCFLGAATVGLVGLAGRRIAGPRVGLGAAALAAIFPTMWMPDGWVLSETMAMFSVALVILAAYRCWDEPTRARTLWLGAALGLAALSRAELILLGPLIAVPLFWYKRRRVAPAVAAVVLVGVTVVALVSPWVLYNLSRFDHVVLLSDQSGETMAASWCNDGFYGNTLGYKSYRCLSASVHGDESSDSWTSYGRDHIERVPFVMAARVARVWGLFRPNQQVQLETYFGVESPPTWAAFAMSWVLLAMAPVGALRMRRRGTPIFPLLAPIVVATLSIALTFGQLRYRAPVEPALVLLAAGVWARPRPPDTGDDADHDAEDEAPAASIPAPA